jgi:hypothetical protein
VEGFACLTSVWRACGSALPVGLTSLQDLSPGEFVFVVAIAAVLSMVVFWHASRRGSRHATLWGVAVFLFAGVAIPVYVLNLLLSGRRR